MKTILVIEDESNIRDNIEEILSLEDFQAIATDNGLEGLQLAKTHRPDLIICDIMMPQLDGYEVLKALRQQESTATIPFIFLTAKAERSNQRQGMELGANDYLTKPFTSSELRNAVTAQLNQQMVFEQYADRKLERLRCSIAQSLPHELRTPLNAIIGFSDLLLLDYRSLDSVEIEEMLAHIHSAGNRLHHSVEHFLLYAQLELISTDAQRQQVFRGDASAIATESIVIEMALAVAQRFDRPTDLELDLQPATLKISTRWFKKMVEELVDNAFKFSIPGTTVTITSQLQEQQFQLSVGDRGRGMTHDQIANLGACMQFERKLYEQQGTGMGLTIVQRLVRLYDGNLSLESIPGQSTVACISLPAAKPSSLKADC